jgi:hypothetical protein
LNDAELAFDAVDVEVPSEALVERLGLVDIRDGDDDDFELRVDRPRCRRAASRAAGVLLLLLLLIVASLSGVRRTVAASAHVRTPLGPP